ncbi:cleft lip and palate transmembrane 1 [Coprinellus micaceus]|uniref:Cleft lip and palate transmembrane 1 n=1 Tax=Coprinellus micaceus TaxID=71717 RepID=A0A4Y7T7Z1_COPMI|nr:cleft lip and palate transmembrane 1 [Coprinellus micaceus]
MPEQRQAAAAPAQQEDEPNPFMKFMKLAQVRRIVCMILKQPFPRPLRAATPGSTQPVAQVDPRLLPPVTAELGWALRQPLDLHVYLSTNPRGDDLPHFVWDNLLFGNYDESRTVSYDVNFPESVLARNGSLWADIFLTKNGANPNPRSRKFQRDDVHHIRKLLTPYFPKARVRKEHNLLSGQHEEEEEGRNVIVPHWFQNVTLALVSDANNMNYRQLPAPLFQHIHLVPEDRDETGTKGKYYPIVYPNEFWHLRSHYIELNTTTPTLPVQFTFQPMSFFKFQMFASMTHGFNEAQKNGGTASEIDEIKRMLLETNPWFLALTGLVSVLHMVFEMLAFKSDVSHWREKKEMVGVSIVTNVVVQLIVLLYLIDNNENTSWMILAGSGMGVVIEAWKITKAVDISVISAPAGSLFPYKLDIKDKHVLSEDEKKTQEYDALAFRYVSYVAIPLLIGYSGYSLVYSTHRGWYSFVISTLTSFVYMFGFAQLVPQLIINYKLKSVAHMPMKAMVYKTLSTVVDDLFAFCIKMPFLHRLACFRDDVVFVVFLYQRWIYRIDPKRINEYGQVGEDTKALEDKKKQ